MKVLVTGSSGHLGEALVRRLRQLHHDVAGLDILASPFTTRVGSIADRDVVRECVHGVDAVLHAATLHKPHVATHSRQAFVDTNITGTLNLRTPFKPLDAPDLRTNAAAVLATRVPEFEAIYAARGWRAPVGIDRVYVNDRARDRLGWEPVHDFRSILRRLARDEDPRSDLARIIGEKGYHGAVRFSGGPYPVG